MQDEDTDPIDFSLLDPSRDELRWQRLVTRVVQRRPRRNVSDQLYRWARPGLALAAGFALVSWAALSQVERARPDPTSEVDLAYQIAAAAEAGTASDSSLLLQSFEETP